MTSDSKIQAGIRQMIDKRMQLRTVTLLETFINDEHPIHWVFMVYERKLGVELSGLRGRITLRVYSAVAK